MYRNWSSPFQVKNVMLESARKKSTHEQNESALHVYVLTDRTSLRLVDPTVMAVGSDAGETLQASLLELPLAVTTTTPAATAACTELLSASENSPPTLKLATDFLLLPPFRCCSVTQSSEATTDPVEEKPRLSNASMMCVCIQQERWIEEEKKRVRLASEQGAFAA